MKRLLVFITISIYSLIGICECPEGGIKFVKQGDIINCPSYQISPEFEANLRRINEENKILVQKITKLEERNQISENRLQLYIDSNNKLMDHIQTQESVNTLKIIGGFLIGVGITYLSIQAAKGL